MTPDKPSIRREVLGRRDAMSQDDRRKKSELIAARLSDEPEYKGASTVLFYVNFRSEVQTRGLLEAALKSGKRVVVPKVDRKAHELKLFEITDPGRDLESGYMGIYEPVEAAARPADSAEIDLVVLPGVGFDLKGRRLGYGGGYYDRLIARLNPGTHLVALAFELQMCDAIPAEEHDKPVDKIITETRVIEPDGR
jgi:5-formyltetrahydrofolate cyclo-ligase